MTLFDFLIVLGLGTNVFSPDPYMRDQIPPRTCMNESMTLLQLGSSFPLNLRSFPSLTTSNSTGRPNFNSIILISITIRWYPLCLSLLLPVNTGGTVKNHREPPRRSVCLRSTFTLNFWVGGLVGDYHIRLLLLLLLLVSP